MLKMFAWHHGSFRLFKHFAGKLSHSRLVSLMFGHSLSLSFFFSHWCNFCFQIPVKYYYIHWFFFVISSVTRLVYPFLRVLYCCIRWGIRFHIFFGHFLRVIFIGFSISGIAQVLFVEPLEDYIRTHTLQDWLTRPL